MRIESFTAAADLVGRRIRVRWQFVPEGDETIADVPMVALRRKQRDFAFPPLVASDPYAVYESTAFPPVPVPGSLAVVDLPDRDIDEGAQRIREQTVTVADMTSGQPREVLRRTVRTVFAADRVAVRQEFELVDVGGRDGTLEPGVTYYYQLERPGPLSGAGIPPLRSTAAPGDAYGHNRTLYWMIPEIHRRHDVVGRPPDAGTGLLPEAAVNGGQLRRLVDVFGSALDAVRSSAERLWTLRDTAALDSRFLPYLAEWIGWDLSSDDDIPLQRNEIRNAPRLFGAVGTIPGLRTMVHHYTGWSTRVTEFCQHVARTNMAPKCNLFAAVDRAGTWWGVDQAAPLLGFAAPNHAAAGGAGVSAELTGTTTEPFALAAGMTLTLVTDGGLPATITFGEADFADIGAATAEEVASVLSDAMGELAASAVGGAVRLRSLREGNESRLEVVASPASPLSLDGAPGGRVSIFPSPDGRLWLLHATTVGPEETTSEARILVKAFLRGRWADTEGIEVQPVCPQGDPAGVVLPGGRLWVAWVDHPGTQAARLRWRRGTPRPLWAAQVLGDRRQPFPLVTGSRLTLTGYGATETFVVVATDYANVAAATAAEVAAAMNTQLAGVTAGVAANGALLLRTAATGPGVTLRVDLRNSNAARTLGFGDRAITGQGGWDGHVDWDPGAPVSPVAAGRHADCTAAVDPEGAVRLFWSTHRDGLWRIARIRWDDRVVIVTTAGTSTYAPNGTLSDITVADGLPSNDVRGLAVDADGSTWYATNAGAAVRRPDGSIAVLSTATTGGGLAHDDVRGVAISPNGTAWFAHAAGTSGLRPDGTWLSMTTVDGLLSNDVRSVVLGGDGAVWFATAGGLSRLSPAGSWQSVTTADGLPGNDVRNAALTPDGSLWVATGAGPARIDRELNVVAVDLAGLGAPTAANDARAVALAPSSPSPSAEAPADGTVWVATAAGLAELHLGREVRVHSVTDGLPSNDCRTVLVAPDGTVWVGTPAGAGRRPPGPVAAWQALTTAEGLVGNQVNGLHGPWSAPIEFLPSGAGDREPHVVRDATQRLWLAWAERQRVGDPGDTWLIRTRRFVWPGPGWSPVLAVTAVPAAGRTTDREPAVVPLPAGARFCFRSDRSGGPRVWTVDVDADDVAGAPARLTTSSASDKNPASVTLPDGLAWLVFRSDRNVALGRLGGGVPSGGNHSSGASPSRRAPEEASVRRFTGSVTALLDDLDRNRSRRLFGDLLDYTPQKPGGTAEEPLSPDEVVTPGTIGLYVEAGPGGRPLLRRDADRLRQLLDRFLPVNLRVVIILRPSALTETIYPPGPEDSFADQYPLVESYGGLADTTGAALPDWLVFLTTQGSSVTVDPAQPTTVRRRLWFPPPV